MRTVLTHRSTMLFLLSVVLYSIVDCIHPLDPNGNLMLSKYANSVYGAITAIALVVTIEIYKESKTISELVHAAKAAKLFEVKDLLELQRLLSTVTSHVQQQIIGPQLEKVQAIELKRDLIRIKVIFSTNHDVIEARYSTGGSGRTITTSMLAVQAAAENIDAMLLDESGLKVLIQQLFELDAHFDNYRNLE